MTDFLEGISTEIEKAIAEGHYVVKRQRYPHISLRRLMASRDFLLIPVIEHRSPVEGDLWVGEIGPLVEELWAAGAQALAIVCEKRVFSGQMEDISIAKSYGLPVLYKDFVIAPLQLEAAGSCGADAALLILSLFEKGLTQLPLKEMISYAHELGLETVLEVFSLEEFIKAKETETDIIGINNRNLKTLTVDLSVTERILSQERADRPVLSESGVLTRGDVLYLQSTGARGVLVGTSILKAQDPASKVKELLGEL